MFEGFEKRLVETGGAAINLVMGGSGPPLLLLHGYPQTHVMWHKIGPRLAEDFTVVAADLRGYGDSGKPNRDPEHFSYSKRAMAQDQVEAMERLGFDSFLLASHDRGARVAHRLTKDHPERVRKLATLDIIPTRRMFQIVDKDMATNTYHWFFLIQPYDFPERVIGADPDYFIRSRFMRVDNAEEVFPADAVEEYVRCFSNPAAIHAGPARITGRGPALTWFTTRPTLSGRLPVRTWPCGARRATWAAPRTCWGCGGSIPGMLTGSRCPAATTSPRKCRRKATRC